ncbi:MAG: Eco57I restriction-modification methylase domain-containing protein, partial [Streptosporangiaceae bacterium]
MPATAEAFVSVHPVGGLLPMDMLRRIADGRDVSASKPADYHVVGVRTSVKDAAERRWGYLKGAWQALRDSVGDSGDLTGLAIENWLLPLFDEHGFGRLPALHDGIRSDDERTVFPVTHAWQHLPIHLVGWDQKLDERPPTGG